MDRRLRKTLDQLRRDVRAHGLWRPGAQLLVACSGGLDSMAMWALIDALAPSLGHSVVVGHLDHGLQPGEDAAAVVAARAAATGQRLLVRRLHLAAGPGAQGRARQARYAALREMAAEVEASAILTAHHADDQAETLLMRATRGAGLDGLTGIRRRRPDGVIRPVLSLDRATLRHAADTLGVRWWEDPSNRSPRYHRNRIRHEVLPALEEAAPGAARGLARTAENLAGHADVLAHWVEAACAPHARRSPGLLSLPLSAFPLTNLPHCDQPLSEQPPSEQPPSKQPQPPPSARHHGAQQLPATQLLAPLLRWVCSELGVAPPSQEATRQVAQTLLRPRPVTCRIHGVEVRLKGDRISFSARPRVPNGQATTPSLGPSPSHREDAAGDTKIDA